MDQQKTAIHSHSLTMSTCKFCHHPHHPPLTLKTLGASCPQTLFLSFPSVNLTQQSHILSYSPPFVSTTNSCSFFLHSVSSIGPSISIFTATIQIEDGMVRKGVEHLRPRGRTAMVQCAHLAKWIILMASSPLFLSLVFLLLTRPAPLSSTPPMTLRVKFKLLSSELLNFFFLHVGTHENQNICGKAPCG